ncbi:MAG TPA: hypothetical protein VHB20_07750 [Verrucomicrobiae bacterium]|jgi:hypothetical protein|nr:hypothetical protein [Verrucomicrobiae bacterium]
MKNVLSRSILCGAVAAACQIASISAHACACGCGMFDVGTASMLPTGSGGMAFLDFIYQDQNRNWAGNGPAPAVNNPDREISTLFIAPTVQYFFNRQWGFEAELPFAQRTFKTVGGPSGNDPVSLHWWGLGDIRLNAEYTGFSDDMSSGVNLGVKLPTGDFRHNDAFGDIDRDTELGSGSADLLLGGFYRSYFPGHLGLAWFAQAQLDLPVVTQDQYRPGLEFNTALGLYYSKWHLGRLKISPLAQLIGSFRATDTGANASGGSNSDDPGNIGSGYQRLSVSPGIELDFHPWRVYADVEIPIYQQMNGNQLVSDELFKFSFSYSF